jgi:protein-tyrosine phosphatase
MIDLHCHILGALDDGAQSVQESLEMCRMAVQDGIRTAVATPHGFDGKFSCEPDQIRQRVCELSGLLAGDAIDLEVLLGMEVRIVAELPQLLKEGRALTLNEGKFVLLEFHPSQFPAGLENLIDALVDSGFGLIIAHPEKNLVLQNNPERLYHLIQRYRPWDILTQITADSVLRAGEARASRTARIFMKHDLAHVIASDAHSSKLRIPRLSDAVAAAAAIVGQEGAEMMVGQIPLAVLGRGDFPEYWPPTNPRRWWRIW